MYAWMTLFASAAPMLVGCVHFPNIERSAALSTDDTTVYVSSSSYRDGSTKRVVVERVTPSDGLCDDIQLEKYRYDVDGEILRRVVERRTCGAIKMRVVDHFDVRTLTRRREVFKDVDQDGSFDTYAVRTRAIDPDDPRGVYVRLSLAAKLR